jgi:hypothetical protein
MAPHKMLAFDFTHQRVFLITLFRVALLKRFGSDQKRLVPIQKRFGSGQKRFGSAAG